MLHDVRALEAQLRLQIGDEAFDAIPDRRQKGARTSRAPRQRRPRAVARVRLAMSGFLPPAVASGFTTAEVAVLSVIAAEFRDRGSCSLTIGEIARRSSACRTTCKNAIHWAARWGLIEVTERRIARDRNAPNRIVITNGTWLAWLRLRPGPVRPWGGGVIFTTGTQVQVQQRGFSNGSERASGLRERHRRRL